MCQTHEMPPGTCTYCEPRTASFEEVTEGMWAWAFKDDAHATPQVTATIVPVPSTALCPQRGLSGQLPRSPKPRHDVLVERPHDDAQRLFSRLAAARPDWVR